MEAISHPGNTEGRSDWQMKPASKSLLVVGHLPLNLTLQLTFPKSLLQQVVFSLELRDKITAIQILFKFLELRTKQTRWVKSPSKNHLQLMYTFAWGY